jgi:hypothetical protein
MHFLSLETLRGSFVTQIKLRQVTDQTVFATVLWRRKRVWTGLTIPGTTWLRTDSALVGHEIKQRMDLGASFPQSAVICYFK